MQIKQIALGSLLTLVLISLLAACGDTSSTPPRTLPTVQSGTVAVSTPGTGPIILLTPTSERGGTASKQMITLADRILILQQVSQKPGADASSTAISITIIITDTSSGFIQNKATFYELVGAEGDAFGTQSSVTPDFYGAIASRQTRSGTIIFQVPTGAAQGLQLLYRPEVPKETVLMPLNK